MLQSGELRVIVRHARLHVLDRHAACEDQDHDEDDCDDRTGMRLLAGSGARACAGKWCIADLRRVRAESVAGVLPSERTLMTGRSIAIASWTS